MCNVAAVEYISSSTFCLQSVYRIYWNNLHAFYLHKFVKAHHMRFVSLQSVQCTKNQNSGLLSTRCTICVCELLSDLQTLPRAVTQSCLREMGIIRTRSSGRRHFEGTLKPSDHQLFLGSSRTSKVSLRLCDGSGGVWQKKSVSRSSAFCLQTCKVLTGPKMFQMWYILTAHE